MWHNILSLLYDIHFYDTFCHWDNIFYSALVLRQARVSCFLVPPSVITSHFLCICLRHKPVVLNVFLIVSLIVMSLHNHNIGNTWCYYFVTNTPLGNLGLGRPKMSVRLPGLWWMGLPVASLPPPALLRYPSLGQLDLCGPSPTLVSVGAPLTVYL